MCLAIPGRILEIEQDTHPRMGNVSFGGVKKRVCLEWILDPRIGEYVIVHVGFALSRMDEKEAEETLRLFQEVGDVSEEFGAPD